MSSSAMAQVVTEPGGKGWVPPSLQGPSFREAVAPILGLDIGLGVLEGTCDRCPFLGGAMLGAYAGLHVHERVSVVADARATVHPLPSLDELTDGILLNASYSLGAQVWVTPELWLRGGGGITLQDFIIDGPDELRWGPTLMLGIGGEQRHRPTNGVDLALHVGFTSLRGQGRGGQLLVVATPAISGHWH